MKNDFNSNDELGGCCLLAIIITAFVFLIWFGVTLLLTYIILWIAGGIFDCDLSDKFWYIFWGIVLAKLIFGSTVTISK